MSFNYPEWEAGMTRRFGPNWREIMREYGRKGGSVKVSKGFGRMQPEKLKAIASKGGRAGRRGGNGR